MASESVAKETPARDEWDFGEVPPDELWHCYQYEVFREIPGIRERVADWRRTHRASRFDDWLPIILNPRDRDRPDYELYAFCPEWPAAPYLAIQPDERLRRLALMPKVVQEHERRNALRLQHLPAMLRWYGTPARPPFTKVFPPKDRATVKEDEFRETFCVTVDWRHHPKAIAKIFEKLILDRRPKDIVQWKAKGKGRRQEQLRARLKALGAWRLVVKWKRSWMDAEKLTADLKADGQPLFDGQSHWLRACKQAEEFLGDPFTFDLAG